MKASRTKFVLLFLVSALAFQFISNSLLGAETKLFPSKDEPFAGTGSAIPWKRIVATVIYPVKIVLIGPLSALFQLPDPPPPLLLLAFALYWTILALVIHYLLRSIHKRKKDQ